MSLFGRTEVFAFLGLGSNMGEPMDNLQDAVDLIDADAATRVDAISSVYRTAPVGGPEQNDFLNMAARVATTRTPRKLLALAHDVEAKLGRVRTVRFGPRTVDVDILLYGERVVRTRDLQIPHPRLRERPFALIPLIEVAPGQTFPDGSSLTAVMAGLAPVEGVTAIGTQVHLPGRQGEQR